MPKIGLGTYLIKDKETIYNGIVHAGYRHLDTAYLYENEDIIGEALQEVFSKTSIKREDLFIVTKIW